MTKIKTIAYDTAKELYIMKWTDELIVQEDVSVSNTYSESAILKLTKMVLNINENNTVDFDINGDVCIGQGYLSRMKELARDIIGGDGVC